MCTDDLFKVYAHTFATTDIELTLYVQQQSQNQTQCDSFGGQWVQKTKTHPRMPKSYICQFDAESQPQPSWFSFKYYLSSVDQGYEESKPLMEKAISRLQDITKDNGWSPLNPQLSVIVKESEDWINKSMAVLQKAYSTHPLSNVKASIKAVHLSLVESVLKDFHLMWEQQQSFKLFLDEIKIKMARPASFVAEYLQASAEVEKDILKNLEMEVSKLQQLQSRNLTLINQTSQLIESLDSRQQILLPKLLECQKSCQRKIDGEHQFGPNMNNKLFDEQNKLYGIIPPGANMHCVSLQGVQKTIDYFNKIPAALQSLREKIKALQ